MLVMNYYSLQYKLPLGRQGDLIPAVWRKTLGLREKIYLILPPYYSYV
jgi:hypothetical protein